MLKGAAALLCRPPPTLSSVLAQMKGPCATRPKLAVGVRALPAGGGGVFKSAAVEVLRRECRLMTTGEICRLALEWGLLVCSGKTPEATMASSLYGDVKRHEQNSMFFRCEGPNPGSVQWKNGPGWRLTICVLCRCGCRPQEGMFGLREWMQQAGWAGTSGAAAAVQAEAPPPQEASGGRCIHTKPGSMRTKTFPVLTSLQNDCVQAKPGDGKTAICAGPGQDGVSAAEVLAAAEASDCSLQQAAGAKRRNTQQGATPLLQSVFSATAGLPAPSASAAGAPLTLWEIEAEMRSSSEAEEQLHPILLRAGAMGQGMASSPPLHLALCSPSLPIPHTQPGGAGGGAIERDGVEVSPSVMNLFCSPVPCRQRRALLPCPVNPGQQQPQGPVKAGSAASTLLAASDCTENCSAGQQYELQQWLQAHFPAGLDDARALPDRASLPASECSVLDRIAELEARVADVEHRWGSLHPQAGRAHLALYHACRHGAGAAHLADRAELALSKAYAIMRFNATVQGLGGGAGRDAEEAPSGGDGEGMLMA